MFNVPNRAQFLAEMGTRDNNSDEPDERDEDVSSSGEDSVHGMSLKSHLADMVMMCFNQSYQLETREI